MPVAWLLLLKATLLRKLHFNHLRFDQLLTSRCRGCIKLNYQCWTPDFLISSSLQSCWTMIGHGFFLSFFSIVKVTVKCLTVRVWKPCNAAVKSARLKSCGNNMYENDSESWNPSAKMLQSVSRFPVSPPTDEKIIQGLRANKHTDTLSPLTVRCAAFAGINNL